MAAILNSAILDSAILHKKKLHSFILSQLDDGSHLEFCHVGFRHCHIWFRHLVIISQIHSKTLSLHCWLWIKLIQSDSNSFILTQLDDGSHLGILPSWQNSWLKLGIQSDHLQFIPHSTSWCSHLEFCQDWIQHNFAQKKLHSFILTQLDDGSHLEFCHVGFRHCHLGFRHLVIFSQIHSKTLSLHADSDSN